MFGGGLEDLFDVLLFFDESDSSSTPGEWSTAGFPMNFHAIFHSYVEFFTPDDVLRIVMFFSASFRC